MTTKEIIEAAVALPVEERALVTDCLLRSLNSPDDEMDRKWTETAKQRLDELRAGAVRAVPGEEVFDRIRKRFP